MIQLAARLILSQVKLMLDKNLIENDKFEGCYQDCPINRVVADTVAILKEQAATK